MTGPVHPRAGTQRLALPAAGGVQLGERHHDCVPGQSFAALDFGRGVWPLHSHWTRAALVAPGVVLNKDGSFTCAIGFRGPDLESSTQDELMAVRARLNNGLKLRFAAFKSQNRGFGI